MPQFRRKHFTDFLLGSSSLSVITQKATSCPQSHCPLLELAGFTTWAQRWSYPLLLSTSRCSLLTRLLLWLCLLLAGSPGSHKAKLIRPGRTKSKCGWSGEVQERVEKRGICGKTGLLVSPGQCVQDYLQKVKEAKEENAECVVLLAKQAQLREFLLTLVYCQLTEASNRWFGYWEKETMKN